MKVDTRRLSFESCTMRYLLGLILACVCTLAASAHTKEILDTRNWPAHLAGSWQTQPTRHNVFFLEQPPDQEDHGIHEPAVVHPKPTPPEQSIFASTAVGLIFLFGGLIGWFLLAASVFIFERRPR